MTTTMTSVNMVCVCSCSDRSTKSAVPQLLQITVDPFDSFKMSSSNVLPSMREYVKRLKQCSDFRHISMQLFPKLCTVKQRKKLIKKERVHTLHVAMAAQHDGLSVENLNVTIYGITHTVHLLILCLTFHKGFTLWRYIQYLSITQPGLMKYGDNIEGRLLIRKEARMKNSTSYT